MRHSGIALLLSLAIAAAACNPHPVARPPTDTSSPISTTGATVNPRILRTLHLSSKGGRYPGIFRVAEGAGWLAVSEACPGQCTDGPEAVWLVDTRTGKVLLKYPLPSLGCSNDPAVEGGAAPYLAVDPIRGRVYVASCIHPSIFVLSAQKMSVKEVRLPSLVDGLAVDGARDRLVLTAGRQVFLVDSRTNAITARINTPTAVSEPVVDGNRVFLLSPPRIFILDAENKR